MSCNYYFHCNYCGHADLSLLLYTIFSYLTIHHAILVCMQGPDDDDAAGMARILGMASEELLVRREANIKLRSRLFIQNGAVVDSILQALHRNRSADSGGQEDIMQR